MEKQQGDKEDVEMLELLQMNWLIIDQSNANNKMHRSLTPLQTNMRRAQEQHKTLQSTFNRSSRASPGRVARKGGR